MDLIGIRIEQEGGNPHLYRGFIPPMLKLDLSWWVDSVRIYDICIPYYKYVSWRWV